MFADSAGVTGGQAALDVGCGPGALTSVLVERLGSEAVGAVDPSEPFVAACRDRHPGVDVRLGRAEAIPFDAARFDVALAQLVLHFVSDAAVAAREMRRVVRPGGTVAACVWDFAEGMQMLRHFWDAALTVDPDAPDEARTMRFGRAGEITSVLQEAGLLDVSETTLVADSAYRDFDELWSGFLAGIGPAGAWCVALSAQARARVHAELFDRLGRPTGAFTLVATARSATGRVPE
ncbi:MAG TPA: class I SAM-dependent methyltransferase [Acidimicrobiales bacterium]